MKIEKQKYKFRAYSKDYPKLYKKKEAKLRKILPKDIKIEHVGSTSVPGLGGKGIMDIAVHLKKKDLTKVIAKMKKVGFEYKHQPGDDRRKFMQKIIKHKGEERRVHIHLTPDIEFWTSYVSFRDYLRKNKKARETYARIKKEGAKHAKGEGKKYAAYKHKIIQKIARKALEEHQNMDLVKQSEKLAVAYFRKLKRFYKGWYYIHSKYVGKAALDINPKLDKEIMQICGWLHDTGKTIKDAGHAKRSAIIAEKFLKGKIAEEKLEIILDCISNHGSSGKPKTIEGKVFQRADKLAIFYPEVRKFLRKAKVQKEKVKEIMEDHYKKVRWLKIKQMARRLMKK